MELVVLVSYQVQPKQEERAAHELSTLIRRVTTTEPGCTGISMLRGESDGARLLLHERWVDKETYLGTHMQTPHIQAFIKRAPEFLVGPPEITFWHETQQHGV